MRFVSFALIVAVLCIPLCPLLEAGRVAPASAASCHSAGAPVKSSGGTQTGHVCCKQRSVAAGKHDGAAPLLSRVLDHAINAPDIAVTIESQARELIPAPALAVRDRLSALSILRI